MVSVLGVSVVSIVVGLTMVLIRVRVLLFLLILRRRTGSIHRLFLFRSRAFLFFLQLELGCSELEEPLFFVVFFFSDSLFFLGLPRRFFWLRSILCLHFLLSHIIRTFRCFRYNRTLFFRVTRRIGFFTESCSDATATLASLNSNSSEDIGLTPTEKGKCVAPHRI